MRAGHEHHGQAADHGHAAAQSHRHAGGHHGAQQFAVGGETRYQFAAAGAVVEIGTQANQVAVELAAEVGHHAFAEQGNKVKARRTGQGQHHGHGEQEQERTVHIAATGKAVVDHAPEGPGQAERRGGSHGQRDQPGGEQAAMHAHEGPQGTQASQARLGLGGCSIIRGGLGGRGTVGSRG